MYDLKGFGCEIKKIRTQLKLSQIEVCHKIGMQRDTIRRLENGLSFPQIETLDRISSVYGRDLYKLFDQYRITIDNYITNNLHLISQHFRNNNPKMISQELNKFEDYFSVKYHNKDDYFKKKKHQYKIYLESIARLNDTITDKSREHVTKLFLSLELTKYDIKNNNYRLDKLELRILVLLGTVYRFRNEFINTLEILDLTLEVVLKKYCKDTEFLYFYILIQFNRMSYFHRMDEFDNVKKTYEDTLKIIDKKIGVRILFGFLTRAGMNKHFMREPHLDGFVQVGLQLLNDNGDTKQYEINFKNLMAKYPYLNLELLYND